MRQLASLLSALLGALLAAAPAVGQAGASTSFSDEQLEQIAAPVALYPDSLLMQVFMAATYPLEVVEADRWVRGGGICQVALWTMRSRARTGTPASSRCAHCPTSWRP